MENSDSGGCETLETPNLFLNPSIVSLVTILIWSCFIIERFVLQVQIVVSLFILESLVFQVKVGVSLFDLESIELYIPP